VVRVSSEALGRLFARYPDAYPKLLAGATEAERLARSTEVGVGPMNFALDVPESRLSGRVSAIPPSALGSGAGSRASSPPSHDRLSSGRSLASTRSKLEPGVFVEEGIAKGREVLVVDQNLCTSCGNCIDACERRHGKSRLQLRGLQVENYMFPTACRHCADPACLLCSVSGIVRLPSGEIQIVEDNCIGCGACAERCPYGNISMHPIEQPTRGFFPSLFDFLVHGSTRERAIDAIDPKTQRIAVKCDLCAGHADHACVTACPVGANFRVDPGSLVEKR
jgi:Fe-S-cluster-containing hydrogenase component 2